MYRKYSCESTNFVIKKKKNSTKSTNSTNRTKKNIRKCNTNSINNNNNMNIFYKNIVIKRNIINNIRIDKQNPKKAFTQNILKIQQEFYIDENYKDNYDETIENWIKDTNSYKVGESTYTGKKPTSSTRNYDDDYIFSVNKNDLIIQNYLKKVRMPYERYLISAMSAYMPSNGIMLDIGTNIGTVAIPMSRANKGVVVFAFEPFRQNYATLLKNIEDNETYNIVPLPVAVGDKPRDLVTLSTSILKIDKKEAHRVDIPKNNNNTKFNFGAIQLGNDGDKVKMISIDSLNLDYDVMKVDIEGAEPLAFYGAQESIKRCMPIIAFEHNANSVTPDMRESLHISDEIADFNIVKYCNSLGYNKIYEIPGDNFILVPQKHYKLSKQLGHFIPSKNKSKFKGFSQEELEGYELFEFVEPKW